MKMPKSTSRSAPAPTTANQVTPNQLQDLADKVAAEHDCDLLLFNADLQRHLAQRVIELCAKRTRRPNVSMILVTRGGDADAALPISHCLQKKYSRFTLIVSGYCKSAGTLVALGAHELAISDQGELGPLDVQLTQKDEIIGSQSGLTATSALQSLHKQAFEAFESFFLQISTKSGGVISTRTAQEIAVKLVAGLMTPVYQHIDPMHLGEADRALNIARDYGRRLLLHSRNHKGTIQDMLSHLVSHYPSHSFIIDTDEARALFRNVRGLSDSEAALVSFLRSAARWPAENEAEEFVAFVSTEKKKGVRRARQTKPRSDSRTGPRTAAPEAD